MLNSEPIIEITRGDKVLSVKAIMPTWNKVDESGMMCISIPLLGNIITHASNEEDAERAVSEAFECFCRISEKHGMGIENELTYIGWIKNQGDDKNHSLFGLKSENPAMNSMMDTGDTRVLQFAE